ncbi:pyridoxal phosphate-dependent aminotransferase [Streptomyces sp. UNOC14_S4]|uniref:pyridoxal phosphate-dependent aminotransferase n=1 Tax=Streptomyces sp. UNOC14_S4 TaxID=2872340 RepID=UPI001E34B148|nr:pyridoxal phosphate-dependent aminotransferase [Streptomyces sp. UNOC14_S4]MCC3769585.1 pyridoxal phosphate-dependent aminotransferase [Streptomyces sp. UNOC14_S4]
MHLFDARPAGRRPSVPPEARAAAAPGTADDGRVFVPSVDERTLDVYARALDPRDAFELRDLWLGRVEHETGGDGRPWLAEGWRRAPVRRTVHPDEVLSSRATVRFVKELFNWYFRDDLYGRLRPRVAVILSSGSVSEEAWGLPETLKSCLHHALDADWSGRAARRGHRTAREAIAAYESARIAGPGYTADNVAVTLGGTASIASLADHVLRGDTRRRPTLCGIPNYPPLVESVARRGAVRLVPLPCRSGRVRLDPLIRALGPDTPMVLLQTVTNPTGALVPEDEIARLVRAASPTTAIVLDECHEWLGPVGTFAPARAAPNVIRVSSLSKTWSVPGLKAGWLLADARFVAGYLSRADAVGPPPLYDTLLEVLARMERWLLAGVESPGAGHVAEVAASHAVDGRRLAEAYRDYRAERLARDLALRTLRDAAVAGLTGATAAVVPPHYSINAAVEFPGWDDSYRCFRDLLAETGVSVFPGILTFCFSGGVVRVTTARSWPDLATALALLHARFAATPVPRAGSAPGPPQGPSAR